MSNSQPSRPDGPEIRTVQLDFPVTRGEQTIDTVQVRRPHSGELRGCSLVALAQMEFSELRKVLPRITQPMLNDSDIDRLDPADLMALGLEVSGFLLPKAMRPDSLGG